MNEVVVADTFFASASKLAANDRARVFDFLAKFHADPRSPGLHFEKLNKVAFCRFAFCLLGRRSMF